MKTYTFNDFTIDYDEKTLVFDSQLWIALFNPLVSNVFKEMALNEINQYIANHQDIIFDKSDHLTIILVCDLDEDLDANEKHYMHIMVWNEGCFEKDIDIKIPLLPHKDYFNDFYEITLKEVEKLTFNPVRNKKIVLELEPNEKIQLEQFSRQQGYVSLRRFIVDTLRMYIKEQKLKETKAKKAKSN